MSQWEDVRRHIDAAQSVLREIEIEAHETLAKYLRENRTNHIAESRLRKVPRVRIALDEARRKTHV